MYEIACTENGLKPFKLIRRKHQQHFAIHIWRIRQFKSKKKLLILNHLCRHDEIGQKTSHATVPLNTMYIGLNPCVAPLLERPRHRVIF